MAIQGTFLLLSSSKWSKLSVPKANRRGKIIGRQRKNGVVTCVATCFANYSMDPFQIPCTIRFDESVLLSNQRIKMVGFCLGLAMPTLVWYTTLAQGTTMSGHPTPIGGTVAGQSLFKSFKNQEDTGQ